MTRIFDALWKMGACDEGLGWVASQRGKSAWQLWHACENPAFLVFVLQKVGHPYVGSQECHAADRVYQEACHAAERVYQEAWAAAGLVQHTAASDAFRAFRLVNEGPQGHDEVAVYHADRVYQDACDAADRVYQDAWDTLYVIRRVAFAAAERVYCLTIRGAVGFPAALIAAATDIAEEELDPIPF